jgi:hypothetical protein
MSMADLVAAGAPELPEGWFYRVKPASHGLGYKVEIREQRRGTSRHVASAYVIEERHDDMRAAVVDACRYAHRKVEERAQQRAKYAALEQLAGDHDPKGGR